VAVCIRVAGRTGKIEGERERAKETLRGFSAVVVWEELCLTFGKKGTL